MKVYTTEEEQIQALSDWFKRNGLTLAISLAVAVLAYFLWNYWQSSTQNYRESASILYEKMQKSNNKEEQYQIANQLYQDYQSTIYGKLGFLVLANKKAEQGEWQAAANDYQAIFTNTKTWPDLQVIVFESWIRSQLELGKAQEAMDNLVTNNKQYKFDVGYPLNFYNLKGDVYYQQGQNQEAVKAYNQALDLASADPILQQQAAQFVNWITLKRNDLLEAKSLK